MQTIASEQTGRIPRGKFQGTDGELFGGQFVVAALLPVLDRLDATFAEALDDPDFRGDLDALFLDHVCRPTPLTRLEAAGGHGASIFLKREDLSNGQGAGAAAVVGQCLLARRMGMTEVVADTGSGEHGVAVAAAAARLRLKATIYIGRGTAGTYRAMIDRMRSLGAQVILVPPDISVLHGAMSRALQHWMGNAEQCLYIAGAPVGAHPYPTIVRHFQAVIGTEARQGLLERTGRLPTVAIAVMDGGAAASGLFSAFLDDSDVSCLVAEPGEAGGPLSQGRPGIFHGARTLLLQDDDGQIRRVGSAAAGASYSAAGPELAAWLRSGRVRVRPVSDADAVDAMRHLAWKHGLALSFESAFGVALARSEAARLSSDAVILCVTAAAGVIDHHLLDVA
ncbi:pyridoxal-phosphate dependent enzyme [Rhizorhabdus sp.]|uniref:pyridoxal-phosphate dependent enzyme n=1 Tax=Rhizorhabdus sp. TaxID=1968843 RepID=UPI0035B24375